MFMRAGYRILTGVSVHIELGSLGHLAFDPRRKARLLLVWTKLWELIACRLALDCIEMM
jgi:hypothetical protein